MAISVEYDFVAFLIRIDPVQYVWEMTTKPGWFLFTGITRLNVKTGQRQGYEFPPGVYASESPVIPARTNAREDGGVVITVI